MTKASSHSSISSTNPSDAVAVAVEMDSEATIYPAVYVRAGGKLSEHALSPHPTHAFDSDVHARELAACLESLALR